MSFMELVGFMEGLTLGVALAVTAFVVMSSNASAIYDSFPASECRSRRLRPPAARVRIARALGAGAAHVVRLRGRLFFGNAAELKEHVDDLLLLHLPRCPARASGGHGPRW